MPELAECKTFTTALTKEYGGHQLSSLEIVGGRFLKEGIPGLASLVFPLADSKFQNKGKFLYFSFLTAEQQATHFHITLGMAASFGQRNKHSAVRFTFDNGEVYYNDIRHFGTIKVAQIPQQLSDKLETLGWDCLEEPDMPDYLLPRIRKRDHKRIAEVLLDQYCFAGLGNYLRSEILYRAGIHPFTLVKNLSDQELTTIGQQYIEAANEALLAGGTTLATFQNLYGEAGSYASQLQVYGRKNDPKGRPVFKKKDRNGRMVHYVPSFQQ